MNVNEREVSVKARKVDVNDEKEVNAKAREVIGWMRTAAYTHAGRWSV